jgi:hypothetical protein
MSEMAQEGVHLKDHPDFIKEGLKTIGLHPISMKHTFLELSIPDKNLKDVSVLSDYPNLMYVDVSFNKIESLTALKDLPFLVQLNASRNQLTECLDFSPRLCNADDASSGGHTDIGSMLTQVNFSNNKITNLRNHLQRHKFLEILLLKSNQISVIEELIDLKFLKVLDLSYNNISKIQGLNSTSIRELNLSGNQINSLDGLQDLPNLTSLNVENNCVLSLFPLAECKNLTFINASGNKIEYARQTEFLGEIPWLNTLLLHKNPCHKMDHYRLRVIYRLPNLERLDFTTVQAEERIRAYNLYSDSMGDLVTRQQTFNKFQPSEIFVDHSTAKMHVDEEDEMDDDVIRLGTPSISMQGSAYRDENSAAPEDEASEATLGFRADSMIEAHAGDGPNMVEGGGSRGE